MQIAERFDLGERIGGGATADVHRAFDHELDRDVVLRLLRADVAEDEEHVERFQREAEAASDIRHPNVVRVLDHGVVEGRPFLVRELVAGSTLEDLIERRGGRLPEEEARSLAEQIARGLDAAHARGLLHRDLNAGNVFVTPEGVAKVVDFGMPTVPRHPAPEQVAHEQIDERADVYGLGAVLYQMLTGHIPPGRVVSPRQLGARVSKKIERIAMRALERDPAQRFPTAAAMGDALLALAPPVAPVIDVPPPVVVPAVVVPAEAEASPADEPAVVAEPSVIESPVPEPAAVTPMVVAPPVDPYPRPRLVRSADPTERIARPARVAPARRRRASPLPFVLLGIPLVLAFLIGALMLERLAPNTAVLSATTTPQASVAPTFPAPTSLPPVETTPEPTPQPTTEPTPEPSLAPAPARTTAPAPPPATAPGPENPAPVAPAQSPAATVVRSFYELINQKRYDEAAALWSPRMQANYPPATNIHGRFDRTREIVIRSIAPVPPTAGGATVAIDILEVLDTGVTRRWVGQWQLVWNGSRWLMDAPNLSAG
ncbi:MAG: serine/threonine protein kinase [Chloroflexota bacterium]|nr:serine/threonine protein kinase [Chloroflexota bacterium]